jgi:hypothetical protein
VHNSEISTIGATRSPDRFSDRRTGQQAWPRRSRRALRRSRLAHRQGARRRGRDRPHRLLRVTALRAGFATSAVQAGVSTLKIRSQTGHASDMLAYYVRDGELFVDNAAGALL